MLYASTVAKCLLLWLGWAGLPTHQCAARYTPSLAPSIKNREFKMGHPILPHEFRQTVWYPIMLKPFCSPLSALTHPHAFSNSIRQQWHCHKYSSYHVDQSMLFLRCQLTPACGLAACGLAACGLACGILPARSCPCVVKNLLVATSGGYLVFLLTLYFVCLLLLPFTFLLPMPFSVARHYGGPPPPRPAGQRALTASRH